MEILFEQHKLHNQGERLVEEQTQEVPQENRAQGQSRSQRPEAKHGSTQNAPLHVPQDHLSKLDISKMARSQDNPYLHLVDEEVNQPEKPKD